MAYMEQLQSVFKSLLAAGRLAVPVSTACWARLMAQSAT